MVEQGPPLLVAIAIPETVAMVRNRLPTDEQQIQAALFDGRAQLKFKKTGRRSDQRTGFCHRRFKGRFLAGPDLQQGVF